MLDKFFFIKNKYKLYKIILLVLWYSNISHLYQKIYFGILESPWDPPRLDRGGGGGDQIDYQLQ